MSNGDMKVNVNAELKADLQPVIDHTPSALNKLFELLFGVRYAEQKRLMSLIEIQKTKDLKNIQDGLAVFDIEKKKLDVVSFENDAGKQSLIIHETLSEEASNIAGCIKEAVRQFLEDGKVSEVGNDKIFSKDFFNHWREEAKLISEDYAQKLWGLVLSEEMKSPDTFSYRTLDILKNLTKHEAELFSLMSQYVVFDKALVTGEHISESDINILVEAGLVIFAGVYRSTKWSKTIVTYADESEKTGHYLNGNAYLIFTESDPEKDLVLTYIPLTQAGQAIYKIAKKDNNWDINELVKAIFNDVKGINEIITFPFIEIGKTDINTYKALIHHRESKA